MLTKLNTVRDTIIIVVISIITWLILGSYDGFEMIIEYLESHEEYELDEILLLIIIWGLLSIFYTVFRVNESIKINLQLKDFNKTLEKKVEETLEKNKQNELMLIQKSKMAAMGEMIGNIAHQWRQPLNSLGLIIQNIQTSHQLGELDDEYIQRSVNKASKITNEMSNTIDAFRNFFKPNKEKEKFEVNHVIKNSLDLVKPSLNHHRIDLVLEESEKLKTIGYLNEFSQVIINIVSNSKDALLANNISDAKIVIKVENKNENIVIRLSDNAGGIKEEIINQVFDPYFTTKEDSGTGIGLYMSKVIIEKNMNGKLEVENIKDGAQFIITLQKRLDNE